MRRPRPHRRIDRGLAASAPRLLLAGLLGVSAALLVSCGSSGTSLIPFRNAGPLESDFQAIAQTAQAGNGSCVTTEAAIQKAEHDLHVLPSTVDSGLRGRLEEGISSLSAHARALCAHPLASTTTTTGTTATTKTSPPATGTTSTGTSTQPTQTTGTQTTPTTSTAPAPTTPQPTGSEGGGTPAEGAGQAPGVGAGEGQAGEGGAGSGATGAPGAREGAAGGATGGTGGGQ